MFDAQTGGFKRPTEAEVQTAYDAINAPLPGAFMVHEFGDLADTLPGEASRSKLLALRQRTADARAVWLPISDEIRELRLEKQRSDARVAALTLRRGSGGPNLDESDPQVADIKRKIEKLVSELERLTTSEQHRAASAHVTAALLRSVEEWLRRGRPGGTVLVEAPVIEVSELLKRGEQLPAAIGRLRARLKEASADEHRIRSAPFPSADVKRKLREQLAAVASYGEPDLSGMIEHGTGDIGWSRETVNIPLVAMDKQGGPIIGSASGELTATMATMIWMLGPEAIGKRLDALVDQQAEDGVALSATDRATKLSEIAFDRARLEAEEAALVWRAQEAGDSVEHRTDCDPRAVLGIELRTVSR
ncbi:hypothetical protein [Bradyrhizobium sp. DASA03120]|uniref:hypothetical protein n=1 Tax=Bradyrhizobium sp. SMVTL-02 TaxID=3395917 RepID=UPI003F6FE22E